MLPSAYEKTRGGPKGVSWSSMIAGLAWENRTGESYTCLCFRPLPVEVRGLLELHPYRKQEVLGKWPSDKLDADRQPVHESAWQRECRKSGKITRRNQ